MNRKTLFAVVLLSTFLLATLFIGTVAANRGQTKKQYVDYMSQGVLTSAVATVDSSNSPNLVITGYRTASGIQSYIVTVNGEEYSYPEDIVGYAENFRLEVNAITGTGVIEVKTVLTFNLPGNPTVTEWISGQVTRTSATTTDFDGVFYVTGTKMFTKLEGGGIMDAYMESGTDYATHTGLIKGWIFD